MKYLLVTVAHFFGDFIFQSSAMATEKRLNQTVFVKHCLLYASVIILALLWFAPVINVTAAVLLIVISHLAIDYLKNVFLSKYSEQKALSFWIFIADQLSHLIVIGFAVQLPQRINEAGQIVLGFLRQYFSPEELFNMTIILFLYFIMSSPAAIFIRQLFFLFSLENAGELKAFHIQKGYLIGILERSMIITLWLHNQLGALGFVLAAKSIARFKQLDDREFAEKYLVGTLLSVLLALLAIMAVEALLH